MQDQFNQWFNQVNGKRIEAEDPSNLYQCFDLAFNWCDFIKIPREAIRHFYAYQIFTQPNDMTRKYFDIVYNSPTNIPKVGDIVVFGQQVGYAGHVAIATGNSTTMNVLTEDQNWNGLQYARPVTHYNYYGVLGWLHPKVQQNQSQITYDKMQTIMNSSDSIEQKIKKMKDLMVAV